MVETPILNLKAAGSDQAHRTKCKKGENKTSPIVQSFQTSAVGRLPYLWAIAPIIADRVNNGVPIRKPQFVQLFAVSSALPPSFLQSDGNPTFKWLILINSVAWFSFSKITCIFQFAFLLFSFHHAMEISIHKILASYLVQNGRMLCFRPNLWIRPSSCSSQPP